MLWAYPRWQMVWWIFDWTTAALGTPGVNWGSGRSPAHETEQFISASIAATYSRCDRWTCRGFGVWLIRIFSWSVGSVGLRSRGGSGFFSGRRRTLRRYRSTDKLPRALRSPWRVCRMSNAECALEWLLVGSRDDGR